ncbi:MAG: threonine synthase [Oscillospiraceae bacterium]|jgi:threonine synthase|nr:threonine synthase [Oscillospiraceae bacterium]
MRVLDTRTGSRITSSGAILQGIAPSGGLYVPERFPFVPLREIGALAELPYAERAVFILSRILPSFPQDELAAEIRAAYTRERFDSPDIAPLIPFTSRLSVLDLTRGPTLAFKDFALQLLPRLMRLSAKMEGDARLRLILVATSGDTGKAALESFAEQDGFACVVFYPDGGVSETQRLQMATQRGGNVSVLAVRGNFDDAQTGVKRLFTSQSFIKNVKDMGYTLASANSINYGRLIPQIVYYFSAYADLLKRGGVKLGEEVSFVVPTGNFGNILACDYARRMGLPVRKTVLASNSNKILYDFITTGEYDTRREFAQTSSPSMDILVSSNLERFLFETVLRNPTSLNALMSSLANEKRFSVSAQATRAIRAQFEAGWADEAATASAIKEAWQKYGVLIDTHTAVAYSVYKNNPLSEQTVIVSTASPFKFAASVSSALYGAVSDEETLSESTGATMPKPIIGLSGKKVLHEKVIERDEMEAAASDFLK